MNMWRFEQSMIDQWIRAKTESKHFTFNGIEDESRVNNR